MIEGSPPRQPTPSRPTGRSVHQGDVGLSFVQRPEDVAEARELTGDRAWLMVKMEKPQAVENLDAIMALTDCVMVARGDLGVELPG